MPGFRCTVAPVSGGFWPYLKTRVLSFSGRYAVIVTAVVFTWRIENGKTNSWVDVDS